MVARATESSQLEANLPDMGRSRVALDYDIVAYGRQYGTNFLQVSKHLGAEFRTSEIKHDHILGNEDQSFIFIHQGKLVLKIVFFDETQKLFS